MMNLEEIKHVLAVNEANGIPNVHLPRDAVQALVDQLAQNAQALADQQLAMIEQTEIAQAATQDLEEKAAELARVRTALEDLQGRMGGKIMQEAAQAVAVPEGWKLVPVEPTEDMAFATTHLNNSLDRSDVVQMLRAAIAAAPQQHAQSLPKWIDDAKGKDPFTDSLIAYIEGHPVQQHAQAAQQSIVAYELHGPADHDGRESPEVRIVFTRKQSDEYTEEGWTLYRELWSSKPTRSFVGEQSVTGNSQAALSDEKIKQLSELHFYAEDAATMDIRLHRFARAILATRQPAPDANQVAQQMGIYGEQTAAPVAEPEFGLQVEMTAKGAHVRIFSESGALLVDQFHDAPVAAAVALRRFDWTRDGMEQDADGAYCYASEAQPPADAAPVDAKPVQCNRIEMLGGHYLTREEKTTGANGWILRTANGRLVRALNEFEAEFVDCALVARSSASIGDTLSQESREALRSRGVAIGEANPERGSLADHLFVERRGDGIWLVCIEGVFADREDAQVACRKWQAAYSAAPPVKAMVDRFLGWKLPQDFGPDCGISFDGRKDDEWNKNKTWPIGTNLLTADQAKAMFEYCYTAPPAPHVERDAAHADTLRKILREAEVGRCTHANVALGWIIRFANESLAALAAQQNVSRSVASDSILLYENEKPAGDGQQGEN